MKIIGLMLLAIFTAAPAFASVEQEAAALEADMNKIKPDMGDRNTIDQQYALVERTRDLVGKILSQKNVDDKAITIVARLLVRNFNYDGPNEVSDANYPLIKKYRARIESAFRRFESEKTFSKEDIDNTRASIEVSAGVHQHGNDPAAKREPNKQSKGKKQ